MSKHKINGREYEDTILPDFERWGQVVNKINYTFERSQDQAHNIAVALKQAVEQGEALGYREGYKKGVQAGIEQPKWGG